MRDKATAARYVSDQQITGVLIDRGINICLTIGWNLCYFHQQCDICSGLHRNSEPFHLGGFLVARGILATLRSPISCFSHTLSL